MKSRTKAQLHAEAARALELHSQGMTERDIAQTMTDEGMSISQPTVHRRIELALELYVIPQLAEAKKQELSRIDAVLQSQSEMLRQGDPKAADITLKAVALRAKLLGLDAPAKSEVVVAGPQPQIMGMVEAAKLRAVN